jgi:type IV pilus assembly protein PilB
LETAGLKPGTMVYKSKGCHHCNTTGYKGRSGIFELLVPDQHIKKLVIERSSSDDIKQYLMQRGNYDTLRKDGLRKVIEGITTLEQVLGVTQND